MARKRCRKQSLPEPEIKVLAIPCTNPKLTLQKILEIPTSPLEESLITIFLEIQEALPLKYHVVKLSPRKLSLKVFLWKWIFQNSLSFI
jgi:hypothetical protein